eukprot:scaffold210882_cov35-Tisochrysis_lutea.AAC.2
MEGRAGCLLMPVNLGVSLVGICSLEFSWMPLPLRQRHNMVKWRAAALLVVDGPLPLQLISRGELTAAHSATHCRSMLRALQP